MNKNGFTRVLTESVVPERPTFSPLQPPNIPEASQETADTHFCIVEEEQPHVRASYAFTHSAGAQHRPASIHSPSPRPAQRPPLFVHCRLLRSIQNRHHHPHRRRQGHHQGHPNPPSMCRRFLRPRSNARPATGSREHRTLGCRQPPRPPRRWCAMALPVHHWPAIIDLLSQSLSRSRTT